MIYPALFKYEIVKDDNLNVILRCDAKSMEDINLCVAEFGKLNLFYIILFLKLIVCIPLHVI